MAVATGRSGMISSGGPVAHQRVRTGPLVTTIALHIGVLAILLSQASEQLRPVERTLSVFSISASAEPLKQAPPKAPQPKLVKPTPPQPVIVPPPVVELPTPNDTVVAMLEQAADVATGGACDLTAPVQAALQSNEDVRASLPRIPRDQRSVANAIMVWKAAWLAEDQKLDATAVAMIRDVVAGTVAVASPECRLQPQAGPRLLMLSGPGDTVVLAVGSGVWRWQDLLDTAVADGATMVVEGNGVTATLASRTSASLTMR